MKLKFISKHKKVALCILGYLIIGYVVVLGLYFLSNPGYFKECPPTVAQFKCSSPIDLVVDLAGRPDFWFQVLVWPLMLITHFGSGS